MYVDLNGARPGLITCILAHTKGASLLWDERHGTLPPSAPSRLLRSNARGAIMWFDINKWISCDECQTSQGNLMPPNDAANISGKKKRSADITWHKKSRERRSRGAQEEDINRAVKCSLGVLVAERREYETEKKRPKKKQREKVILEWSRLVVSLTLSLSSATCFQKPQNRIRTRSPEKEAKKGVQKTDRASPSSFLSEGINNASLCSWKLNEHEKEVKAKKGGKKKNFSLKSNKNRQEEETSKEQESLSLFVYFFEGYITLEWDAQIHLQGRARTKAQNVQMLEFFFGKMTPRMAWLSFISFSAGAMFSATLLRVGKPSEFLEEGAKLAHGAITQFENLLFCFLIKDRKKSSSCSALNLRRASSSPSTLLLLLSLHFAFSLKMFYF